MTQAATQTGKTTQPTQATPLLSIISPIYHGEKFIVELVNQIRSQLELKGKQTVNKSRKWWWYGGGAVVVGTAAILLLNQKDSKGSKAEPLATPPDWPTNN